ncbi:MAG: hypothetical protein EOP49_26165, partial [Sphingobacteriales bacterium]
MMFFRSLNFILNHPYNRHNKISGLLRYIAWQISYRINPKPVVRNFTANTKFWVWRGLYGITGNLYCGLMEYEDMTLLLHILRDEDTFFDIGANAGVYTVQAMYAGCLSEPGTFQVTHVSGTATVSITSNATGPLAQGSTLMLSASGPPGDYMWGGPNGFGASGTSPYIQNVTVANAGTYGVLVYVPNCPDIMATITIQVAGLRQITGTVRNDNNNNGLQDTADSAKPNVMVNLQPGNLWEITDANGQYTFHVNPGTYTVSYVGLNSTEVVTPASATVTVSAAGQGTFTQNFLVYTPPFTDVMVQVAAWSPPSPGFFRTMVLGNFNAGSQAASGFIKFVPDSLMSVQFPNSSPGYVLSGDTIMWAYNNLLPGQLINRLLTYYTPISVSMGTILTSYAGVTPLSGDLLPANNHYPLQQVVVASYDPNDKQVLPLGDISPAQVASGKDLLYTIRFQNTGTAPAVNVLLVDSLSDNLDLGTLKMVSASHNYNVSLRDGRVLEWHFPNIMLPDSNANEPESHGFVQYRIQPKTSLIIGDEIENTAHIYFDFNEAIVTNTTSTIVNILSAPEGLKAPNSLLLYPNPNSGNFTIKLADCENGKVNIKLLNMLGQEMYSEA